MGTPIGQAAGMTQDRDMDEPPAQKNGPRYGPLLTIAVAILALFGAVSRVGKPQAGDGLLHLDLSATQRLDTERLRAEEERLRAIVTLGAVATREMPAEQPVAGVRLEANPMPPERGEFDIAAVSPISLSMEHFDPAPEAEPVAPVAVTSEANKTYVVQEGDTWVKVGKKVGKDWKELQKANPGSYSGLRVGMKLKVP